jgi:hypothetical protein
MTKCNHNLVFKVLSWINWIIMLVLGSYNIYVQFRGQKGTDVVATNPVNKLLSIYIALFGLVGVVFEAGVTIVVSGLKFLKKKSGKGIIFIFVGTLGLAFIHEEGHEDTTADVWDYVLMPVILGGFSCAVGVYAFIAMCCGSKDKEDEADGRYVSADDGNKGL